MATVAWIVNFGEVHHPLDEKSISQMVKYIAVLHEKSMNGEGQGLLALKKDITNAKVKYRSVSWMVEV